MTRLPDTDSASLRLLSSYVVLGLFAVLSLWELFQLLRKQPKTEHEREMHVESGDLHEPMVHKAASSHPV